MSSPVGSEHGSAASSPRSTSSSSPEQSFDEAMDETVPPTPKVDVGQVNTQLARLSVIPVVFVILRLWGSINVIKDVIAPDYHFFAVDVIEAFGDQAQAAVYCVVLVLANKQVRDGLRVWWRHGPLHHSASVLTQTSAPADPPSPSTPSLRS